MNIEAILAHGLKRVSHRLNNLLEPRNEFGMTAQQEQDIVALAKSSQQGYDAAVQVALMAYELTFPEIDRLLAQHGIHRQ